MTGRAPVFVTRKFPPSVGGMETLAAGVWRSLVAVRPDALKISHGGANQALVWWVPLAVLRLVGLVLRGRVESVLLGDALMNAICSPLLKVLRIEHGTMVMGLDVTYQNPAYRRVVHPWLRRSSRVIAISSATADAVIAIGTPADRVSVLRLGVQAPVVTTEDREAARRELARELSLTDELIVLTLGRLVRRKGVLWFVSEVLPSLPTNVHHVIAGSGEDRDLIQAAAQAGGVADRIHLPGQVDDPTWERLMRGADLFVQPNVVVPGDMEGFGLVAIEAALRGTPVAAANLEGLADAVVDGETGILLPTGEAQAWIARLNELLTDRDALPALGSRFQAGASVRYSEASMGQSLVELLGLSAAP